MSSESLHPIEQAQILWLHQYIEEIKTKKPMPKWEMKLPGDDQFYLISMSALEWGKFIHEFPETIFRPKKGTT